VITSVAEKHRIVKMEALRSSETLIPLQNHKFANAEDHNPHSKTITQAASRMAAFRVFKADSPVACTMIATLKQYRWNELLYISI
jgi:hypothetical protein